MEVDKKLLRIAGILYGISGAFLFSAPVYGIFLLIAGVYIYSQANESEEEIHKNRVIHYIIGIIGMVNIVSSVLVLCAQDNIAKRIRASRGINAPPKVIYKLDKESRKIDILLKLGVAMIFISGLLFATTSWDFMNDYLKAFALILFGSLFLGLSIYTEKKLKLYRSSYMYWLLSVSLFMLTVVGILYFGIFGEYLTYVGSGSKLAYAITFLTGAGFAITTYCKFPKKYLLFSCYGLIAAGIASLFSYMNLSEMMVVSLITIIVMILNILIQKKGAIHTFSRILSYILFGFIMMASSNQEIEVLFACMINVINLNYLTFIDKKDNESVLNILLTYILIIFGLVSFKSLGDSRCIMIALTSSVYTLLINGNIIPTKSNTQKLNYIGYSFIMFILFLISIEKESFSIPCTYVFIALIHLGINTMIKYGLFRMDSWKVANYIQPLMILWLVESIVTYFHDPITSAYELAIVVLIYCGIHFFSKEELDKNILFGYIIGIGTIFLLQLHRFYDIYSSLLLTLSSTYVFILSYKGEEKETKVKLTLSYLLLLSSIYVPFVHHNILEINILYPSLLFIVLIFVLSPLLKKERIQKISYLYIILPLTTLIETSGFDYEIQKILGSITGLYIVFLFNKFFIKNSFVKNLTIILGIVLFCTNVLFTEGIYSGIYIGILGILVILLGYKKDELFPIFITGIILTILNIIYRLKEVWKVIPFWLYLLVGGLTIIGFVTYREIKKQSQKELETKSNN